MKIGNYPSAFISLFTIVVIGFLFSCENREEKQQEKQEQIVTEQPWYKQPMRIAAMQCNFDEDNLAVIDKWVDMGFNTEQLFHPMADYYSALYNPSEHGEILRDYVAKAHENGIKIILYLNVHILGPSIESQEEFWSQRQKDGTISYMYTTYPSVCLNSPWRDHFFSVLDSLKAIEIDGIFLDGPVITNGGCYCEHCQEKYHNMFDGKPGSEWEKRWEFNAFTKDEFLQDVYDYFKKNNPDKIVYMNLPVASTREQYVNIGNALNYNDIVGTEGGFQFYQPAKNAYLWRPSFSAKLIEAVAPEKPRVIFMAADHKPWSWWLHSPLETKLCISSITANAANVWYGIHGSSKLLNTASADAANEVLTYYKEHEKFLINTKSEAEVALFYSFTNASNEKSDFNESITENIRGNTEDAIRGYFSMLTESQIPFDLITDYKLTREKLSRYKVLIVPNVLAFDINSEVLLREFVEKGGLLIAESGISLFNEKGAMKDNFALTDVLGISTSGVYKEHNNFNYFTFESQLIPLPLLSLEITANAGTNILCRALKDLDGRYVPLTDPEDIILTSNDFGKGKAVYFAGNFGEMYNEYHVLEYKAIIHEFISKELTEALEFVDAPTNLEVILRKQGGNRILHLINYQAGPTRPFEKVTIIHDLKIRIPKSWNVTAVNSQKLNKELNLSTDKSFVEVTLPELKEYEMLILE